MKGWYILLFSLWQLVLPAQSDDEMMQNLRDDFNYGEFNPGANHIYYGVKQKPGVVKGDAYLDPEWHKAAVVFYPEIVKRYDPKAPDSIAGYMVRVDLINQVVEFQLKEGVKAVDISSVRKLYYESGRLIKLVNGKDIDKDNIAPKGFLELLSSGKLTVVKAVVLKVKEPTYNVALDVGEKDAKIYKKGIYYYMEKKGAQNSLVKFKPSKKKLLALMGSKADKVEKYISANGLSLKNDADLQRALDYYNSL
jgi:hypothetical protein